MNVGYSFRRFTCNRELIPDVGAVAEGAHFLISSFIL